MLPIIRDDFLNAATQDALESHFLSHKHPWYYYSNVNYATPPSSDSPGQFPADDRFQNAPGFANLIYPSPIPLAAGFDGAKMVLESFLRAQGIVPRKLIRIKANLLLRRPETNPKPFMPHVDLPAPHWVLIYYVNDSDGDTLILDKTYPDGANAQTLYSIQPKKGRAVLFDGNHYHAGTPPAAHETRCVLNFDFL